MTEYDCQNAREDIDNFRFRKLGSADEEIEGLVRALAHISPKKRGLTKKPCKDCGEYLKDLREKE